MLPLQLRWNVSDEPQRLRRSLTLYDGLAVDRQHLWHVHRRDVPNDDRLPPTIIRPLLLLPLHLYVVGTTAQRVDSWQQRQPLLQPPMQLLDVTDVVVVEQQVVAPAQLVMVHRLRQSWRAYQTAHEHVGEDDERVGAHCRVHCKLEQRVAYRSRGRGKVPDVPVAVLWDTCKSRPKWVLHGAVAD